MKKSSLFCFTLLMAMMASTKSNAQEFYVRGGLGWVTESGKTEFNNADPNGLTGITQSTDITVGADGSTRVKSLSGTLGGGFKGNVTLGYMFNPYIGAEIGLNYFDGDKRTIGKLTSPEMQSQSVAYLRGLDVMPAVYLTPAFAKLNPYARIGLLIPAAGKLHIETVANASDAAGPGTDVHVEAETEVESRFSVGFAGALGVTYPIGKKLHLFGEIEFKNLSIKSKSAEIKKYETLAINRASGVSFPVPGQQLADLPRNEKEFQFEDSYTENDDPNAPRKIPTQYVNVGGIGINVGIRYSFGK